MSSSLPYGRLRPSDDVTTTSPYWPGFTHSDDVLLTQPMMHYIIWDLFKGGLSKSNCQEHHGDDRPETNYKIMLRYDCRNKCNFSLRRNSGKYCAAVMSSGRLFQSLGHAAKANQCLPTLTRPDGQMTSWIKSTTVDDVVMERQQYISACQSDTEAQCRD